MILYADAATTGPWLWGKPVHDRAQPHLIRLALLLETDEGQLVSRHCDIIRPMQTWGPILPTEYERHRVSAAVAMQRGHPLHEVLRQFLTSLRPARQLVGHSAKFHHSAILRAFGDANEFSATNEWPPSFCTMTKSGPVVRALNSAGKQKWPTLQEAYRHFSDGCDLVLPDDPIARGDALVDAVRFVYRALCKQMQGTNVP